MSASSQWDRTVSSCRWARISASRMRLAFCTGTPSSDSATAPAAFSASKSVSACPFCPRVTAPIGQTCTPQAAAAFPFKKSICSGLSTAGRVLGMQAIEEKPPRAAARAPVSTVSLYSKPGSRRWTCISTRPAHTTIPLASMSFAPGSLILLPITATLPSSIRMSITPPIPPTGSTSRPWRISSFT